MAKQRELFKRFCKCEDDDGQICNEEMSKEEDEQDGMCSNCADKVFDSLQNGTLFFHGEIGD